MITKPNSTHIFMIDYDESKKELHLTFNSGKTYTYHSVSPSEHRALVHAPSVGSHFDKHIKPVKKFVKKN